MRVVRSAVLAGLVLSVLAGPVGAASFPEHVRPPACEVVVALPHDIVGHLLTRPAASAAILTELLTDACFGGP
jgi:hypothetical protein